MNTTGIKASDAVNLVVDQAKGLRCYLTGSSAASAVKARDGIAGFEDCYSDVDLFVGSENEWVRSIQFLIDRGYTFGPRMEMMWTRVLHFGTHGWHTNSMKLHNPEGVEVNLIYKTVARKPVASLSQVIETFDFGLLALGWETETGIYRDMRPYMFGDVDLNGPLPVLPWRKEQIEQGHFREHQGLRMFGRAARYFLDYGYDDTLVRPVLVEGYQNAASYYKDRIEPEKIRLGEIYQAVSFLMEDGDWTQVKAAADLLPKADELDELYTMLIEP